MVFVVLAYYIALFRIITMRLGQRMMVLCVSLSQSFCANNKMDDERGGGGTVERLTPTR